MMTKQGVVVNKWLLLKLRFGSIQEEKKRALRRPGIYAIVNKINGNQYVGQTTDIHKRWLEHLHSLRKNVHANQHLQAAFNKYKEPNFAFAVLEYVDEIASLLDREQFWIERIRPDYNIRRNVFQDNNYSVEVIPDIPPPIDERPIPPWRRKTRDIDKELEIKHPKPTVIIPRVPLPTSSYFPPLQQSPWTDYPFLEEYFEKCRLLTLTAEDDERFLEFIAARKRAKQGK